MTDQTRETGAGGAATPMPADAPATHPMRPSTVDRRVPDPHHEAEPIATSHRELLPDALRGFALFGILMVNIMSFAGGLDGGSLGAFTAATTAPDRVVVALVAFLAEYKFYPIFSFLFGYGFALFWRKARLRGADTDRLFARRVGFMAVLGIAHGVLIWFGDILSRYALVALLLKGRLHFGPKRLLLSIRRWLVAAVLIAAALSLGSVADNLASSAFESVTQQNVPKREANTATLHLYAAGSYGDITQQRLIDYANITVFFAFLVPQVLVLFLCGAFIARAGWLRHADRHRDKWARILRIGLYVGVPANLAWAALQVTNAMEQSIWFTPVAALLDVAMPVLAGAYVAAFALLATDARRSGVFRTLACAGRMPLTNYLSQSVICSFLLYGYGLGLGDDLRQSQLALLAVGIYAAQLVWSRAWLARFEQGPMEMMWRRFTYAPPAGS